MGERVLIKQDKTTIRPPWDTAPYVVMLHAQVMAKRGNNHRIRNIEKWKVLKERPEEIKINKKERKTGEEEFSDDTDFEIDENKYLPHH